MDNHFDRRERTIYVWMLERSVTDDQLYLLFSKIGPIEKLIFKEYADGTPQHCLIVFRYVDSVLTAMSTLQGIELNGKPISLRPLRESTHAVLMPASTMYPSSASSSTSKERTTTVRSSDGLSDDYLDDNKNNVGGGVGKKLRSNWDAASSGSAASSGIWNTDALESATEMLSLKDDRRGRGGAAKSRSRGSFSSSVSSPAAASPSNHSPSPPPSHLTEQHHAPAIHSSLRAKPTWRPSRGPIPAPLLTGNTGYNTRFYNNQEEHDNGGYGCHAASSAGTASQPLPPSLFSQIFPSSPGYGGLSSPTPYSANPHHRNYSHHHYQQQPPPHSASFFTGGTASMHSPRPLFPEMYKSSTGGFFGSSSNGNVRLAAPTGVFSPTAAPEEVVWRQHQHHHHQPPPPPPPPPPPQPLMSPPCTAGGGKDWFDYGEYSVPQAYRGSATEQQLTPGGGGGAGGQAPHPPLSLGGMLPPNSPPIGQCTPYFDFPLDVSATLPHRLRPSPHLQYQMGGGGGVPPSSSARPPLLSPYGGPFGASVRCAPRAPRSAAPFGANSHQQHGAPFAWPEFGRTFGARF